MGKRLPTIRARVSFFSFSPFLRYAGEEKLDSRASAVYWGEKGLLLMGEVCFDKRGGRREDVAFSRDAIHTTSELHIFFVHTHTSHRHVSSSIDCSLYISLFVS